MESPRLERASAPLTFAWVGDIDLARKDELDRMVDDARQSRSTDIVVDLRAVTFLDSTGIGTLVRLHHVAADRSGRLRLVSPVPAVRRALEVAGIHEMCDITG